MYQLKISPQVFSDLNEIKEYISEGLSNIKAANDIVKLIAQKIRTLTDFPFAGNPLNSVVEITTDYRYLVCNNYLLFYRVENQTVYVIRVIYGRRDYIRVLFGEVDEEK